MIGFLDPRATLASFTHRPLSSSSNNEEASPKGRSATTPSSRTDEMRRNFFAEDLANDLASELDIPFVPQPILVFLMTDTIEKIASDLSTETLEKFQEFCSTALDDLSEHDFWGDDEIDSLANQIAADLNPVLDVPIFDEEQEEIALQQICRILLRKMQASSGEERRQFLSLSLMQSQDLISDRGRSTLLEKVKAKVPDIPFLPDGMEEKLVDTAVNVCIDSIEGALPSALVASIRSQSPSAIADLKVELIEKFSTKVKIPGISEDQALSLVDQMVDLLLDVYLDLSPSEADKIFLTEEEQIERLEERQDRIKWDLDLCQRRYEREKRNLMEQLEAVEDRLGDLQGGKERQDDDDDDEKKK